MEKIKNMKGIAKDGGYLPSLPQFSHLEKESYDKTVVRDPVKILKPISIGSNRYNSLQKKGSDTYAGNNKTSKAIFAGLHKANADDHN